MEETGATSTLRDDYSPADPWTKSEQHVSNLDVAIVGAGPYGLSVAAHVAPFASVRVFGPPMETWRDHMPPDMLLRSEWEHTNLSAPRAKGSLNQWSSETRIARSDPIPLQTFLRYADWFIDRFVPPVDHAKISSIDACSTGYGLRTADGRTFRARSVVVATGVTPFPRIPAVFQGLDSSRVALPSDPIARDQVVGRRVVVIGGGQNALEAALRMQRAGATRVDIVVRSTVRWFAEREPYQHRGRMHGYAYRAAYPIIGFGPPPFNRLVLHPGLFAQLPEPMRQRLNERMLRPGGSPWLRQQLQGSVHFHEHATIIHVDEIGDSLRLVTADGCAFHADRVVIACGFRFDLARVNFLRETVKSQIKTSPKTGWPLLSNGLCSTAPGLHFAGYPAEGRFGPLVRFIEGARFAAERCAAAIRQ